MYRTVGDGTHWTNSNMYNHLFLLYFSSHYLVTLGIKLSQQLFDLKATDKTPSYNDTEIS